MHPDTKAPQFDDETGIIFMAFAKYIGTDPRHLQSLDMETLVRSQLQAAWLLGGMAVLKQQIEMDAAP